MCFLTFAILRSCLAGAVILSKGTRFHLETNKLPILIDGLYWSPERDHLHTLVLFVCLTAQGAACG